MTWILHKSQYLPARKPTIFKTIDLLYFNEKEAEDLTELIIEEMNLDYAKKQ